MIKLIAWRNSLIHSFTHSFIHQTVWGKVRSPDKDKLHPYGAHRLVRVKSSKQYSQNMYFETAMSVMKKHKAALSNRILYNEVNILYLYCPRW